MIKSLGKCNNLEVIRDHLLELLWHDFKPPQEKGESVVLNREHGWQLVSILDDLIEIKNLKIK